MKHSIVAIAWTVGALGCSGGKAEDPIVYENPPPPDRLPAEPATAPEGACTEGEPLAVTSTPQDDGSQLIFVECERYAYQSSFDIWVRQADGNETRAAQVLGYPSVREDGAVVNFERARGPGDCGTWKLWRYRDGALVLEETRERDCSDEAPEELDPSTWPLVAADPCTDGPVWYRCRTTDGKWIQLCGKAAEGALQYRFGDPASPELVLPPSPSTAAFGYNESRWVRAMADTVSVANGEYAYHVVDKSGGGAFGEGEMNNFQGVVVTQSGEEVARIGCREEGNIEGLGSLAPHLRAIGYLEHP